VPALTEDPQDLLTPADVAVPAVQPGQLGDCNPSVNSATNATARVA
jgi:hypothetical protein